MTLESIILFSLIGAFLFFWFAIALFAFVFWVWMIIDCAKRDFKKDVEKIVWILVLIFTGIIGAIIYYFVVKNGKKRGITK